jgi:hypothetical protein
MPPKKRKTAKVGVKSMFINLNSVQIVSENFCGDLVWFVAFFLINCIEQVKGIY